MFCVTYMLAELSRRRGRTLLTALGLAIGVGLVDTVNALSRGLDRAQAAVLEPLTGLGTDMTVSRPIDFSDTDGSGFPNLSQEERDKLREENGGRLRLARSRQAGLVALARHVRVHGPALVSGERGGQDPRPRRGGFGRRWPAAQLDPH